MDVGIGVEISLGGGEGVHPGDGIVFYKVMVVALEVGEVAVGGGAKGIPFDVLLFFWGEVIEGVICVDVSLGVVEKKDGDVGVV